MTATRFDTLAYAKRLQDAGVDPKIAEAQAVALAEVLTEVLEGISGGLTSQGNHSLMERNLCDRITRIEKRLMLLTWMVSFALALLVAILSLLLRLLMMLPAA